MLLEPGKEKYRLEYEIKKAKRQTDTKGGRKELTR